MEMDVCCLCEEGKRFEVYGKGSKKILYLCFSINLLLLCGVINLFEQWKIKCKQRAPVNSTFNFYFSVMRIYH